VKRHFGSLIVVGHFEGVRIQVVEEDLYMVLKVDDSTPSADGQWRRNKRGVFSNVRGVPQFGSGGVAARFSQQTSISIFKRRIELGRAGSCAPAASLSGSPQTTDGQGAVTSYHWAWHQRNSQDMGSKRQHTPPSHDWRIQSEPAAMSHRDSGEIFLRRRVMAASLASKRPKPL
jgi:hypothetical protein